MGHEIDTPAETSVTDSGNAFAGPTFVGFGKIIAGVFSSAMDAVLFIAVLCFTGIAFVAVAIAAPLAVGISAIVGRKHTPRSGWRRAKAS